MKLKKISIGLKSLLYLFFVTSTTVTAEIAPKSVPPATEEMQRPGFWISQINGDPDRIIMTPEQAMKLNRKNLTRTTETTDINGNTHSINKIIARKDIIGIQFNLVNPLAMLSFSGDSLRARLMRSRSYVENKTFFDIRGEKYDEEMKKDLYEMTDFNSIPDKIIPHYGILTSHTLNRLLPTNLPAYGSSGGWLDQFQSAGLDYGSPVSILHTSKDCDWYYVRSEIAFGWVSAAHVAEGSAGEIEKIVNAQDFIVPTCHKVPVYGDKDYKIFLADLYMGERLPLRRKSAGGYEITVPFRDADGSLKPVTGWVKPDADVSAGFQKFTQSNVINTVFSLLYRPYGWADSYNERDCCGTMRAVFRTFGIFLPRWTKHQSYSNDHVFAFPRETPKEKKYEILDACEPAVTLLSHSGHVVMYLGKVDGIYYVIHQSGYSYKTEDGKELYVKRVNINSTELNGERGSHVDTWTEISEFKS